MKPINFQIKNNSCFLFILLSALCFACSSSVNQDKVSKSYSLSKVWVPDNGDGTYKNPVLHSDYSDPDAIRVEDDYYMISSSFNCVPGIPILHSNDLVNWNLVAYVFDKQMPKEYFNVTRNGQGVWAPSIRFHKGKYYIYYGDPDFGIYMTESDKPEGSWSEPVLVKEGKGWIDPCPFWDNDGKAYLVHAWAGSRAGLKSILTLHQMSKDGKRLLDDGVIIFDGHINNSTVEGPKMYQKNGYYYVFAPAGGVSTGWQLALRSKNIWGPYEYKVVLNQGTTNINGPHQGAWVDTKTGEDWFIHFQDMGAYGRIVHLQPMIWKDNWPFIGIDNNNDGIGEPVSSFKKPDVGKSYPLCTPPTSDEFNAHQIGLQWQWHANPLATWGCPSGNLGYLRLNAISFPSNPLNFWYQPNILLQKFPAEEFSISAKFEFHPNFNGDQTGLIIMGEDYSHISVKYKDNELILSQSLCIEASDSSKEEIKELAKLQENIFFLRVDVSDGALCQFSYSKDSVHFTPVGFPFKAKAGRWIGAKAGVFCKGDTLTNNAGYVNIDWFRVGQKSVLRNE